MKKERSEVEIRDGRQEDLGEVCAIENRNFPAPRPKWWFNNFLFRSSGDFLVATDGKSVLGYAIGIVERDLKLWKLGFKEQAHLLDIAVEKEERRRGIGTSLLRVLIDRFKKRGVGSIKLEVRTQNIGAREFYQSLGFKKNGLKENYYPDGDDALVMTKSLD